MSGSTTEPAREGGLPDGWDQRLRYPPIYALYRAVETPEAIACGDARAAHTPRLTFDIPAEMMSERSRVDCENVLAGAGSGARREYRAMPMPWRQIERVFKDTVEGRGLALPWRNEDWWRQVFHDNPTHWTVLVPSEPGLVAYFQNEEKGARNIRTKIKAGRYLMTFASHLMTEKQIAYYAQWLTTGKRASKWGDRTAHPMTIGMEANDFAHAYESGPRSCMSGGVLVMRTADGKKMDRVAHPSAVYAAGDLGIAVLHNRSRVAARALCWPDRKVFGRIYPNIRSYRDDGFNSESDAADCVDELSTRLREAGYKPLGEGSGNRGSFAGARIALIPVNDRRNEWLMPYIDGNYGIVLTQEKTDKPPSITSVKDEGGNVVPNMEWVARLSTSVSRIACQETRGTIQFRLPDDPAGVCRSCGHRILRDRDIVPVVITPGGSKRHAKSWCHQCASLNAYQCTATGLFFSCDVPFERAVGGGIVNARVASDGTGRWRRSKLTNAIYDHENYDTVLMADGVRVPRYEIEQTGFVCSVTGRYGRETDRHPRWRNVLASVSDAEIERWIKNARGL